MDVFIADLRQSFWNLIKTPSFTVVAVAVLALGIGANTAVFTLLNEVMLRPLPYPDSDRLVTVVRTFQNGAGSAASIPKFNVWKKETQVLDDLSAFDQGGPGVNLRGSDLPELVKAIHVSANYFALFGARTTVGRVFSEDEDKPGAAKVAVLSHALWARAFGSDRSIVGKSVSLGNDSYVIAGVINPDFRPQPEADVWLPLQADPNSTNQGHFLAVAGKLKPGVTLAQANAQLKLVGDRFRLLYPEWMDKGESVAAVPMQEEMAREFRPTLLILMGAVTFVLLIACANLASLLLARAVGRQRALTIRLALGANRGQLIRYLLTESVLVAVAGGVAGMLLAYAGLQALNALVLSNIPDFTLGPGDTSFLDWRVLLFTLGVSVVTGLIFGIVPALQFSRPDISTVLQQTGGRSGMGSGQHRTRSALVVSEIAIALVLLISATLLIRTIAALRAVDAGFDARNVMVMTTSLNSSRYRSNQAYDNLSRQGRQRLEGIPGVLSASPAVAAPLTGAAIDLPFNIDGKTPPAGNTYNGDEQWRFVGAGYFSTLSIPIRKGRVFTEQDTLNASRVVVINEAMAKKYWANEDPIGKRITIAKGLGPEFEEPAREIVGVVGNVRELGLNQAPPPVMYVPMAQISDAFSGLINTVLPLTWIVRATATPASLSNAIKKEFTAIDSQLAVARIRPLAEVNSGTLARETISMNLLTVFAFLALLLAAVGIYGLMAHAVQQRTQEIGVRMSLGATGADILKLVLGHAVKLTFGGVILGVLAAIGLTRVLSSVLFEVKSTDPVTFGGVSLVLIAIALLAAYIPARRAVKVNPVIALRRTL